MHFDLTEAEKAAIVELLCETIERVASRCRRVSRA
jgi:hypothetical protein